MAPVRRTRAYRNDYRDIYRYAALNYSIEVADKLIAEFELQVRLLSEFPEIAPLRSELRPDLRGRVIGRYVIFYRVTPTAIELLRVLHTSRDTRQIFRRGS